ncbi:MAG: hypothetical protein FJ109_12100 [Deltaproteobacteria bacterium]|nr:hypothetical protein [Deltaproteobacteria bacterium]
MRIAISSALAGVFLVLTSCGGSDTTADAAVDAAAADQLRADVPGDAVSVDQAVTDALETLPEDAAQPGCCDRDCVPKPKVDAAQRKFALSMFHFNIQYVVGGLDADTPDGGTLSMCGEPCEGWTDDALHDWYVRKVFEPVMDLYLGHPGWTGTFEFQGLLLDVVKARHPDLLEKMRQAAQTGAIEMVSIHYSDQFFEAFPRHDLQLSTDWTRKLFLDACIPLSGVVFNQEGQAGEGKHRFMGENGYEISVFPVNLYKYYHWQEPRLPLYTDRGVDVVIGPDGMDLDTLPPPAQGAGGGLHVTWTFFDDGDLLAYPPSPYLAPFYTDEEGAKNMNDYRVKLEKLAADGYRISGISNYVAHLKAMGVEAKPLPPVLDGTWQPKDTNSVHRWLGGRSIVTGAAFERDNTIRTWHYRSRTDLHATSLLAEAATQAGVLPEDAPSRLEDAWRHMLLAEVSDVTGITPWMGEYYYGVIHATAVDDLVASLRQDLLAALGWKHARADIAAGTAESLEAIPVPDEPLPAAAPLDVSIDAPSRTTDLTWLGGPDLFTLRVEFGPSIDPTGKDAPNCKVTLSFPRFEEAFIYTPALAEDEVVRHDMKDFSFQLPEVYLPLSNGLIGLGDDWWVVKVCGKVHVAARIPNTGDPLIQFVDETADPVNGDSWELKVFHGSQADALALARTTNTHPIVEF